MANDDSRGGFKRLSGENNHAASLTGLGSTVVQQPAPLRPRPRSEQGSNDSFLLRKPPSLAPTPHS
ncbi:MAG: hypothetical protein K9L82_16180, partial [Chromatiaceae bacterium]|nr:hypothetical protein [Chromatiaceae bacterium]